MKNKITPEPYYTLIDTSIGNDPAVVVVNSALRNFKNLAAFPWHLRINIDCKLQGQNGMPTTEESKVLHNLEVSIATPLQATHNAIFLARITARNQRVLLYRVHDPEAANDVLQILSTEDTPLREWEYEMEHDATWELAKPELHLLEQDPRFN
ncbi:TPA: DUF695 domain-containing protein [Stenotrophomonas maltophilia]|uniref:DUF695 domain-containing protein n=1 Tax=Stenotrophomonas maltophilia TaxID=40324 RepID=UPI0015DEDABE|nr:DUF695 domain-containing protein [Stenotrophomonas maltophilia]MBA0325542.1 DUF695 domain-containing protein [Stenotrophomonas maltophilia]